MKKENFDVSGMTCSACTSHVNNAVSKLSGVKFVGVNLLQNSMTVEYDENLCNTTIIENAVKKAGYSASLKSAVYEKNLDLHLKNAYFQMNLTKIIVSFAFLLLIMYFSMGNMMWNWWTPQVFDHHSNPVGFALIQFILLIPIVYINFNYFKSGFKKLFKGNPNMDSLIAVSSTISILYGIVILFLLSYCQAKIVADVDNNLINVTYFKNLIMKYHESIYFESAGMILCFVSLGKYFENLSKKKTTKALEKLIELAPKTAIILENGIEKQVEIKDVKINDIIIVKKGQTIPVDGEVVSGFGSVNESSITGESMPVAKQENDKVLSSSLLENGYLKIKAVKVGEDTSISKVIRLVEEASNSKAPISKLADKISGIFVPIIFVIAFLTFIINLLVSHSFELSLEFAITVTVIACPCALGLATPVAIMVGTGKGAESGLLIKNAEIMEKANLIKTIVFDKTGTITEGRPTVSDYIELDAEDDLLSIIYSIEKMSEHPLARSITEFADSKGAKELTISNFESIDGFGIKANYNDDKYYIGNIRFLERLKIDNENVQIKYNLLVNEAKIPLIVVKNNTICAIIAVKDKIKENSVRAISMLKQMGIKIVMLTGDNKNTAQIVAQQVGVDEVYAEVRPDEKLNIINSLKTDKKHLVAMVGDGVNDAPSLLSADLGIAIGAGSEIAIETSDIVLLKSDLLDVVNIIRLSSRILKTIKLGLFWAFFYNSICVLIATGLFYYSFGFKINPMIGTIAMSISSVSVVLNALTINSFKPIQINKNYTNKNLLNKKSAKNYNFNPKINDIILNLEEIKKYNTKKGENIMEFYVKGMMCQNCQNHIKTALENNGIEVSTINLDTKKVIVNTTKSKSEVFDIIKSAGYEATND